MTMKLVRRSFERGRSEGSRLEASRLVILDDILQYGAMILEGSDPSTEEDILRVARMIGDTALGIDEELSGPFVMDIKHDPSKIRPGQRPSYFTSERFPLHTDLAYVSNSPRFLLMQCVHPGPIGEGAALLADCADAFAAISTYHQAVLSEKIYIFTYPPNCPYGESETFPVYENKSYEGHPRWRFRDDSMQYPERAKTSIAAFRTLLEESAMEYRLERGDMVIVDNYRMTHGRSAFVTSDTNVSERHIRRAYAQETAPGKIPQAV